MKRNWKKVGVSIFLVTMMFVVTACGSQNGESNGVGEATVDREGFSITLPDEINRIITIGPSNAEIIVELGFGENIIQTDVFTTDVPGISDEITNLDIMSPDLERIIELDPDIVFVTGMTRVQGDDDPLRLVSDAGIAVIYMPTSTSIEDIKEDIRFIAKVLKADERGEEIIADMTNEIQRIREIGAGITDRRTVYFEISPAPHLFSFGRGTFLNEMIEVIGAVNIFADEEGWIGVADESLLEANPDVILTSVNFLDDPIDEIVNRPGWDAITAVQNGDVFIIDTAASNRQSHNIIRALKEMAMAIYPDEFR